MKISFFNFSITFNGIIKKISLFIVLFTMHTAYSQDLSSHQWKDRIIILLTDDVTDKTYQKQIYELQKNEAGLQERKLIVYHVKPEHLKEGLSSTDWKKASYLFDKHKKTNSGFEFVLVGLDGGIKLQQSEFITCEKLFSIIDKMPMRRIEVRNDD